MAQILEWSNKSIPFVRRHHVGSDALKPSVPVGNCRDADEHNVDFAVVEDLEGLRFRQLNVLTYILSELVDRDAETCKWFHGNRTFPLLATIRPTAELGGDAVGQAKGSRDR